MPDTIQQGQFLNRLKNQIKAITTSLDEQGTTVFENRTQEAHEIRQVVSTLIYELGNHGISMQDPTSISDEEIQQAIEVVEGLWTTMKTSPETLHPSMRASTLHPALAANILAYTSLVNTSHWTPEDGFRFQRAWEAHQQ